MSGQDLRLYLIWDSEEQTEEEDFTLKQLFQAVDEDDEAKLPSSSGIREEKKKRKRSSDSESEEASLMNPCLAFKPLLSVPEPLWFCSGIIRPVQPNLVES